MKRFVSIVFCLGLCTTAQAIDRLETHSPGGGFPTLATVDAAALRQRTDSPDSGSAQGLYLDAELLDREGRRWILQWKLFAEESGVSRAPGYDGWHAGVVLTTPDGELHERLFAPGAGLVGRLSSAADDWEWHPQGAALLPAKLRFDVDGREVILLLEAQQGTAGVNERAPSRVRVRGFVNLGIEKTYLSGRGQLQHDRQRLAGRKLHSDRSQAAPLPADSL